MGVRLVNAAVVIVACFVGFLICEFGYRIYLVWEEIERFEPKRAFIVYSQSIWEFDAALGYDYRPEARMDSVYLKDGVPRRCSVFTTSKLGAPGEGSDVDTPAKADLIVLGDSFTAIVHDGTTWPDIFAQVLRDNLGRNVSVLNLSKDGYGVLQMFDQAAQLARTGLRPDAFIIAIIGLDLVRDRFWRMTFEHDDRTDVFTSIEPSLRVAPETHVRTFLIHPAATRDWCESARAAGKTDPTAQKIEAAVEQTRRADEAFFGHRVRLFSLGDCYICNLLRDGQPLKGITNHPQISFERFQEDAGFVENVSTLRASGVPVVLVYLPYISELRHGRPKLSGQARSLLQSVKTAADHFVDLTPEIPMRDAAEKLTLLPEDMHPSRAGLEYYAQELYKRMAPLWSDLVNSPQSRSALQPVPDDSVNP